MKTSKKKEQTLDSSWQDLNVKSEKWLSVDPGTQGLGIAYWEGAHLRWSGSFSWTGNWVERSHRMTINALNTMTSKNINPDFIIFEEPFTTLNAASAKKDVVKLSAACGMFLHGAITVFECTAHPITVMKWKGQTSKSNSTRRIKRSLLRNFPDYNKLTSEHEMDSIGIGLYVLGMMK